MTTISKSEYLAGLQCPKLLWHHYNQTDALPPLDPATQAIFEALADRIVREDSELYPAADALVSV